MLNLSMMKSGVAIYLYLVLGLSLLLSCAGEKKRQQVGQSEWNWREVESRCFDFESGQFEKACNPYCQLMYGDSVELPNGLRGMLFRLDLRFLHPMILISSEKKVEVVAMPSDSLNELKHVLLRYNAQVGETWITLQRNRKGRDIVDSMRALAGKPAVDHNNMGLRLTLTNKVFDSALADTVYTVKLTGSVGIPLVAHSYNLTECDYARKYGFLRTLFEYDSKPTYECHYLPKLRKRKEKD